MFKKKADPEVTELVDPSSTMEVSKPPSGFTLYIDCAPSNATVDYAEHLLADTLRNKDGVPWDSPSLKISYQHRLDAIRDDIETKAKKGDWAGKHIRISSGNIAGRFIELLMEHADEVVR